MISLQPRRNYRSQLVALCLLGVLFPVLDAQWSVDNLGLILWTAVFWVVLYTSMRALRTGLVARRVDLVLFALAVAVGLVALILGWRGESESVPYKVVHACAEFFSLALLLHVASASLQDVLRAGRVDMNKIWGAVSVYILIGLTWAYIFGILDIIYGDCLVGSGSFDSTSSSPVDPSRLSTRLYFSFVTLTTVGYGDIAPANSMTRLFATVEALVGQLYLTILVARLVGLHISHNRADFDDES